MCLQTEMEGLGREGKGRGCQAEGPARALVHAGTALNLALAPRAASQEVL